MLIQRKHWRLLFIVLFICGGFSLGFADRLPLTFAAELSGEQMVPPVETIGHGHLSAVLIGDQLVISGSYSELSSEVLGHGVFTQPAAIIHRAAAGETGIAVRASADQVYPGLRFFKLFNDGDSAGNLLGVFKLSETQIQDLSEGLYYVVVHTGTHGRGELRGQLLPTMKLELSTQDLIGMWEKQSSIDPNYLQFSDDGTYAIFDDIAGTNPYVLESGTYTFDGSTLTYTAAAEHLNCPSARGVYSVMLTDGGQLRFFPHDDECHYRLSDLQDALLLPVTP